MSISWLESHGPRDLSPRPVRFENWLPKQNWPFSYRAGVIINHSKTTGIVGKYSDTKRIYKAHVDQWYKHDKRENMRNTITSNI